MKTIKELGISTAPLTAETNALGEMVGREAACHQHVTDCHGLNAAAMREALEAAIPIMRACLFDYYNTTCVNKVVGEMKAALSAPPRNCDRPECATTKAAQETWRKEDGGKTAYYEWLFAEAKGYEKMSEKAGGIE